MRPAVNLKNYPILAAQIREIPEIVGAPEILQSATTANSERHQLSWTWT